MPKSAEKKNDAPGFRLTLLKMSYLISSVCEIE